MLYRKCKPLYRECKLLCCKRKLPHRKCNLNGRGAPPEAGLPSPSSLRDATSPKVRGFGCTGKFAFSKKLSLWESWREAPERARTLAGRLRHGLAGAYDGANFRKSQSKRTRCAAGSGFALSVIAPRCHLSQSERPWQSAKFPVLYFTPCCRNGSRQALRSDFTPLPRALPLGELDAVRRPERARTAEGTLYPGLAGANDGADFRKPQSKLTRYVLVSGLALSVIASRCHLSQSERPWQSAEFSV